MCLNISKELHSYYIKQGLRSIRSTRLLLVWKFLSLEERSIIDRLMFRPERWLSPYQRHHWRFGDIQQAVLDVNYGDYTVDAGLHAYVARSYNEVNRIHRTKFSFTDTKLYPAVVPLGTEFFLSNPFDGVGEIAATKMVVFKDLDAANTAFPGIINMRSDYYDIRGTVMSGKYSDLKRGQRKGREVEWA